MMLVKDLIKKLEMLDQDLPVVCYHRDRDWEWDGENEYEVECCVLSSVDTVEIVEKVVKIS